MLKLAPVCPVLPGDTRITMVYVSPLDPADLIPKEQLLQQLRKEAPDFMAEILGLEIPASGDRLNVPVVMTSEKMTAERASQSRLEEFIAECCFHVTGSMIKYSEFVDRFYEWLDASEKYDWSKHKVGKALPHTCPRADVPSTGSSVWATCPGRHGSPARRSRRSWP